jgi:DNA-binding HxlR family transcriptional regulator
MTCSIAKALDVVGDPWTLLVVRDALLGVDRFEDFVDRLGIPRATLAARLAHLCDAGVLHRRDDPSHPRRARYELTDKGRALRPVVLTLMRWGDDWVRTDDPPTRLVDGRDGRLLDPVLVDRASGVPIEDLPARATGPLVPVGRTSRNAL